jgi:excisionase family DNA binding protein
MTTEGLSQVTLSVQETAKMLGIPARSVYEHIKQGRLPCLELGQRKLVLKAGLEKMLQDAMTKSAPVALSDV